MERTGLHTHTHACPYKHTLSFTVEMHAHTQDRSVTLWPSGLRKANIQKRIPAHVSGVDMPPSPELSAAMHHPGGPVVKEAGSEGDNDVEGVGGDRQRRGRCLLFNSSSLALRRRGRRKGTKMDDLRIEADAGGKKTRRARRCDTAAGS